MNDCKDGVQRRSIGDVVAFEKRLPQPMLIKELM
jgi:hypothetical protein